MKNFFKNKSVKDWIVLGIIVALIIFDIIMICQFVYYKSLPLNGESSLDINSQSEFEEVPYQDEIELNTGDESTFDLSEPD